MKVTKGRIVVYAGNEVVNGESAFPAIVTQVFTNEMVNLTVFAPGLTFHASSVAKAQDHSTSPPKPSWSWPQRESGG